MTRFLLVIGLLTFCHGLIAQPTIQDCLGAIPVCQATYTEDQSPAGEGNIRNEIPAGVTCIDGDNNSIWYVFNASQDGLLGFLITPNDLDDDYDWALFNLTGRSCSDLSASNLESCNAAGGPGCHGQTGCSASGSGNYTGGGCNNTGPINALVPMQAGEVFVLVVSNWTGSRNGYTIDFSESTGLGVFDEVPPYLERAYNLPESCGERSLEVEFHEFIQCNSVFGSDFQLNGPGGPYTLSVSSADCSIGSQQSRNFRLTIDPPIASMGEYELIVAPAAADHLLDLCGNQSRSDTIVFAVEVPLPETVNIGRDTSLLCAGDQLTLDASAVGVAWQWDDGSTNATRIVDDAGVYGVVVTTVCGVGEDEVEVFVQQTPPTLELGADAFRCPGEEVLLDADNGVAFYEWQDGSDDPSLTVTQTGTYAVTVTNGCGTVTDARTLTYVPPLGLGLATEYALCAGDTLAIEIERPYATYRWADGSTAARRYFTEDGTHALTVTTVCETYEAAFSAFFLVDPQLELGGDTLLCPRDSIILDAGIPGSEYRWQDGSNTRTYTVREPGTYRLEVTTACNELRDSIRVDYVLPVTTNLGRDTFICPEDPFLLDASTAVAADYRWEDGSADPKRLVFGPGNYAVTVTSQCEKVLDTLTIAECEKCPLYLPNAFSPNRDGVNDRFLPQGACPLSNYELLVYDRWGNQVFVSQDPANGWDGRSRGQGAAQGAYIYFLRYTVIENGIPRRRQSTGEVVLLR